jgi:AraC family transcriptional regulator
MCSISYREMKGACTMRSLLRADILPEPATARLPGAISVLIESAIDAFDADRDTSRRYLLRASAILRAQYAADSDSKQGQETQPPGGLAMWQVNRVVDYIEEHLGEKITARDLAELVNISVGQMFRAFKVSVGASPFRYIARRRMEFACALLKMTREPLAQVAIASGLCDQSHLCRVVRRMTGMSPAKWRRANASDPELGKGTCPLIRGPRGTRWLHASLASKTLQRTEPVPQTRV